MDVIEIDKFCQLYSFCFDYHYYFSHDFVDKINKILRNRINEIPKEYFPKILYTSINLSVYSVIPQFFHILEDVSNFEKITDNFERFEDVNYLLWSSLTYAKNNYFENIDDEIKNLNLRSFTKKIINMFIGIEEDFFVNDKGTIELKIENNNQNDVDKIYQNMNEKIIKFLEERFNIEKFLQNSIKKIDNSTNIDKFKTIISYFQTVQLLLEYIKINFYHNLNEKNLFKFFNGNDWIKDQLNKSYSDLKEEFINFLSNKLIKSDSSVLDNFVLIDAVSQNSKEINEDLLKNIDVFFSKKPNCSIYQNLIDDYFNAMNISIVFEIPKLENDQFVIGIDANKYSIILINDYYFSKVKNLNLSSQKLKLYENRLNILSNIHDWKTIIIRDSEWNSLSNKQAYLKEKIGYDMQEEENIKIRILNKYEEINNIVNLNGKKEEESDSNKKENLPKYNLTKQILSKKNLKKN